MSRFLRNWLLPMVAYLLLAGILTTNPPAPVVVLAIGLLGYPLIRLAYAFGLSDGMEQALRRKSRP